MTSREWLRRATRMFADAGNPDARVDARLMLEKTGAIIGMLDQEIDTELLDDWLRRRLLGEPTQYILNEAHFMGLSFYVDSRVLIPRQDTETLCEAALPFVNADTRVLDLCTGSGALAVAIKRFCKQAMVTACDIDEGALDVARINAQRQEVSIEFLQGDLLDAAPGRSFDVIVCNPPYINDQDMGVLQCEVKHEPALALYGGTDGLVFYRRIIEMLPEALDPGGVILFEVGYDQATTVADMLQGDVETIKDIAGIDRVVIWKRTV